MSCPDWSHLAPGRDDSEQAAWQSAVAHLDHCSKCWPAALRVEPTLIFRRLPEPEIDPQEIEEVRAGVAVLRRSRGFARSRQGGHRAGWGIAAAVLLAATIALAPPPRSVSRLPAEAGNAANSSVPALESQERLSSVVTDRHDAPTLAATRSAADAPLIEKMGDPGARIYQLQGKGVAVVMIVDRHIDV